MSVTSTFNGKIPADGQLVLIGREFVAVFFRRDSGPVHTYPDIFESATFSFRIRLSSTRIRWIRKQIRKFLNPLSRVEIFESDNISDTCGRSNLDIFWYDVVTKIGASIYLANLNIAADRRQIASVLLGLISSLLACMQLNAALLNAEISMPEGGLTSASSLRYLPDKTADRNNLSE